jgi:hypothetical protein
LELNHYRTVQLAYSAALWRVKSETTCFEDFPQWVQLMRVVELKRPK